MARWSAAPYLLLLPAIVLVLTVIVLPILLSLWSSLTAYNLTRPASIFDFVGLRNYQRLLGDMDFLWALGRTVVFVTFTLNLELLTGLGLALIARHVIRGQKLLRTLIMLPMMFSPILVGFQFKYMFNDNIGIINNLLFAAGLIKTPILWLIDPILANVSVAIAEIWMSSSVFAILLLAGLISLPREPVEAAKVDGCNNWQTFRHVTLPLLMPFIYIALTIRSLDVARAYDIVRVMTNGGPAARTELVWTLAARVGYENSKMGVANAMGFISIILSLAFTFYFFRKLAASRRYMGGVE